VTPDPQLEALLTGGTVFNDTSTALGAGGTPAVTSYTTGGVLAAGTYDYAVANYNRWGPSEIGADVTVVTTGSTSVNIIAPASVPAGAFGSVIYGRIIGLLQQIGKVPNIGSQETGTGGIATGTITSIPVAALTEPIPQGTTFTVTGDTNTPPVVFTAAETGLVGSVTLAVESVTVASAIGSGLVLIPVFVDTGVVVPSGLPSTSDLTAGPGLAVGQQAHSVGVVANPNGIGLEFFMERIIDGHQATDGLGYIQFVIPRATNFVVGARDATNAEMASVFTGDSFENPNFGEGPAGDFEFDTSKVFQWAYCNELIVPVPSYVAQTAGF
jgi:hypothetical protein